MRKACFIVASPHWDREWYRTFDSFRVRLCALMRAAIETLERTPALRCFTLDGQVAPLDDFLELYPDMAGRARALIEAGRLVIGPSYVLADSFLVSGEGLIRNLIAGKEACARYGGGSRAGYLPDMFGHASQMPQILKSFGIESAIMFRGLDTKAPTRSEFVWRGSDGTEVLGYRLAYGYWNLKSWSLLGMRAAEHFGDLLARLDERSGTGCHLMINGSDHLFLQPELPDCIDAAAEAYRDVDVVNASLDDFVAELARRAAGTRLEIVEGELRYARDVQIEPSVYSTRCDIKQLARKAENLLEGFAEPLSTLASLLGSPYPRGELERAWKELIWNYPHDSVCTVSSDAVHEEVAARYRRSITISEELMKLAANAIGGRAAPAAAECARTILVLNPRSWPRRDAVIAEIDFPAAVGARDLRLIAPDGSEAAYELLCVEQATTLIEHLYTSKEKSSARRFRIRFIAEVPPLGYAAYRVLPLPLKEKRLYAQRQTLAPMSAAIENEFFEVRADRATCSFSIRDKESGIVWEGVNAFCDAGDAGDEYQYAPPLANDYRYPSLESLSIERNSPLSSAITMGLRLVLPRSLSPDRRSRSKETIPCALSAKAILYAGVRRVDFESVFDNGAEDHILYARFPLPERVEADFAHTAFDVVHRSVDTPPVEEDDNEALAPFKPMHSFAGLSSGGRTMMIANRGTCEYRTDHEGEGTCLSLTLLRATGWLFKEVLPTSRDGQPCTTPEVPTPASQCPGRQIFEYSFVPAGSGPLEGDGHRRALDFARPLAAIVGGAPGDGELPSSLSLLSLSNPLAVLSSVSLARDGAAIVRLYNISDEKIETDVGSSFGIARIARCALDGTPIGTTASGVVKDARIHLRGKEIAALRIEFGSLRP
jgi:mannosylglycerate hydrolase